MEETSKLVPEALRAQCKAAISRLKEDNQELDIVASSLELFTNNTSIQSDSFNLVKQQINDYQIIIQAMKKANSIDIFDYQFLTDIVGNEILDGSVIEVKYLAETNKQEAEKSVQKARRWSKVFSTVNPLISQMFANNAHWYEEEIIREQITIAYCQEKINLYDKIEVQTSNLFMEGDNIRSTIREALSEVGDSFQKESYLCNKETDRRKKLDKTIDRKKEEIINEFYLELPVGWKNYLTVDDFVATADGFVICKVSIEEILLRMEMQEEDEIYDGNKVKDFDDWYLSGVVKSEKGVAYTIIKMREIDDEQASGKGTAVPFIELDMNTCSEVFAKINDGQDISDQEWRDLNDSLYGVIKPKGNYSESVILRDYFANPGSDGSYLIADCFVEKISKSDCFVDGKWKLTVTYEENDKFARDYLDELEILGIYNKENNTITVNDVSHLTQSEYNAILTVTTGNIDAYSFAGENYWHAVAQQIADGEQALGSGPVGLGASRLLGNIIEKHSISSDAGVGESKLGNIYESTFKDPDSYIYNQQKDLHPGR